jgi:hypothetical protein
MRIWILDPGPKLNADPTGSVFGSESETLMPDPIHL